MRERAWEISFKHLEASRSCIPATTLLPSFRVEPEGGEKDDRWLIAGEAVMKLVP